MTKEQIESLGITYVEGMTDDEVIAKITEAKKASDDEIAKRDATIKSHKSLIDKYSSEIADFKKKANENLTAEEQQKLEMENLRKSNEELTKKLELGEKIKGFTAQGIPADVAEKLGTKLVEGKDISKDLGEFIKSHDEALKQEIMKNNPQPNGGGGNGGIDKFTKENFQKGLITMEEMSKLKETNPDVYNSIIG